jgi:hypothetical protein
VPIAYRIDHERKIVVACGYGLLTTADVFDYQRTVWSRQDVAGYDELADMTHVAAVDLPSAQRIRDLASMSARMDVPEGGSRFAIVAPSDLTFGLGRMLQAYRAADERSTKTIGVFRTMAEALVFLQLLDQPLPPPLPSESGKAPG